MRNKLLTIILSLLTISSVTGQKLPIDNSTGKVVFQQVIELDSSFKADQIFSLVKEWFSVNGKTFNRSNSDKNNKTGDVILGTQRSNSTQLDQLYKNDQPLKLQDPADKKLIGKGVLKYSGSSMGCLRILYFEFDIKVLTKDSRLKIEISNFNYTHYNQMTMKQVQINSWTDEGPCNSKNTIESLMKCEKCKGEFADLYSYLTADMDKVINDLKTYLTNNKKKESEW